MFLFQKHPFPHLQKYPCGFCPPFSHQNKAQDLSLTLCLPIWTASCVTYFYPAWSFLADSWGHVLVASELSLDLSKVLMGFLAFFKLLTSIFFLLPSSTKRKIHVIHQQLSLYWNAQLRASYFCFPEELCHVTVFQTDPTLTSLAQCSSATGQGRYFLPSSDSLCCLFCFVFIKFVERQVGMVVRVWILDSGDTVSKPGSAFASWVTFTRLLNLPELQCSHPWNGHGNACLRVVRYFHVFFLNFLFPGNKDYSINGLITNFKRK